MKNIFLIIVLCLSVSLFSGGLSVADAAGTEASPASQKSENEGSTASPFDRTGGYIHPFLAITEFYTDNVWNTSRDKKSDWGTVLSGGISLSVPRTANPPKITTSTITPGGMTLTRIGARYPGNYQTFLSYKADYEIFARNSSSNTLSHTAVGSFHYKFRSGLSIEVFDQFLDTHESRGTGQFFGLDKYRSNMLHSILSYEIGQKFLVRADYSNYNIRYQSDYNDFRDRSDNVWSAYLFYKASPKMAMFGQYQFIDISYGSIMENSKEHNIYGGINWYITEKTEGILKAGYGKKNFDTSYSYDARNFIYEAQILYHLSQKTALSITASRKTVESDILTSLSGVDHGISADYRQFIRKKLTFNAGLSYDRKTYNGEPTINGVTKAKVDDIYSGSLSLRYEFKRWLNVEAAYTYTQRNSTFDDFDYKNNTFLLRLAGFL